MQTYETLFITTPTLSEDDERATVETLSEIVTGGGGPMVANERMGRRRLAYPIKGHRKGTYWITYFRIDGSQLSDLERRCQINDLFLRHLFLKVEPRIADALVQHAKGEEPAAPERDGKADAKTDDKTAEKGGGEDKVAADAPA